MILLLVLETGVNGLRLARLCSLPVLQCSRPHVLAHAPASAPAATPAAWKFLAVDTRERLLLLAILILYFKPRCDFDIVTLHDVALRLRSRP